MIKREHHTLVSVSVLRRNQQRSWAPYQDAVEPLIRGIIQMEMSRQSTRC